MGFQMTPQRITPAYQVRKYFINLTPSFLRDLIVHQIGNIRSRCPRRNQVSHEQQQKQFTQRQ